MRDAHTAAGRPWVISITSTRSTAAVKQQHLNLRRAVEPLLAASVPVVGAPKNRSDGIEESTAVCKVHGQGFRARALRLTRKQMPDTRPLRGGGVFDSTYAPNSDVRSRARADLHTRHETSPKHPPTHAEAAWIQTSARASGSKPPPSDSHLVSITQSFYQRRLTKLLRFRLLLRQRALLLPPPVFETPALIP